MALSNAERQRLYRERHRQSAPDEEPVAPKVPSDAQIVALQQRNRALEEEVRRLKRLLAERSPILPSHQFGSPRPAPKPSQSRTSAPGRGT